MAKKVGIAVGIAIAAVAISMTYGAIANPGGIEEKLQEKFGSFVFQDQSGKIKEGLEEEWEF